MLMSSSMNKRINKNKGINTRSVLDERGRKHSKRCPVGRPQEKDMGFLGRFWESSPQRIEIKATG